MERKIGRLATVIDKINQYVGESVKWLVVALLFSQFLVVIIRYVFGFTFTWLNESVQYFHATIFMLGAGYTLLHDGHVRVDIFYAKMSDRKKALLNIFGYCFFLCPSLITLAVYSWSFVENSWSIWEASPVSGGIDAIFLLKSLIPAFAVLVIMQGFSGFLRNIIKIMEN